MRNLLILVQLVICLSIHASEKLVVWAKQPVFSVISDANKDENVVGIFTNEKYEFYHNDEGNLEMFHTFHKKYRLNNDESINQFNKISISAANVIEVVEINARAIKPDGSVVIFDENSIKEVVDEDGGQSYKIFAIDGIEVGDDVEYYVIRKMRGGSFGRAYFQFKHPIQAAKFELISPKELLYDVKGYNGFPGGNHELLDDERNMYTCEMENLPALKDEKFSYLNPRKARVEFRLDYNFNIDRTQRLTWDEAAQRVYNMMYLNVNNNVVEDWLETIPRTSTNALSSIKEIETYIKDNIYIEEFGQPEFNDLKFVLANKVTNIQGVVRLYAALFNALNINHELVITSERDRIKFDGAFQSWNYLDKYLIYFPDEKTYLDPESTNFNLGCFNGSLSATEALFIERVRVGEFESAIGKIKYIEPLTYHQNYHHMLINLHVDVDDATARVETTQGYKGLSGGYINTVFKKVDKETQEAILSDLKMSDFPVAEYTTLKTVESCEHESLRDAEFLIYSDITTEALIEEAGNKLLINIGATIGEQAEMYFEEDRTADVENFFNRWYYREIRVNIPDGYKILNPEVADMEVVEKVDEEKAYVFESAHTYDGTVYKIIIDEYYKEIFVDPENFEGFKRAVNAAADFNKVVLVLQEQ